MSDAIQVWQISLSVSEATLERYFTCLSRDEQLRANRFRFADDSRRFMVARGTLRHLLGRQLARPPEAISFCYSEYGKPFMGQLAEALSESSCEFHFNLSHSGELAICALGGHRQVGVDVERVKPMQRLDSLMNRCLSADEQDQVKAVAIAEQPRAFLQRWTCKEAYLKAIGLGLSQSMQAIEVQLSPPLLVKIPNDCEAGWNLHLLALPDAYVGALVVTGQVAVQLCKWQHAL